MSLSAPPLFRTELFAIVKKVTVHHIFSKPYAITTILLYKDCFLLLTVHIRPIWQDVFPVDFLLSYDHACYAQYTAR